MTEVNLTSLILLQKKVDSILTHYPKLLYSIKPLASLAEPMSFRCRFMIGKTETLYSTWSD